MSGLYVVCFDVRDARRLRKIADALENFGTRVQRSVFECHLDAAQLAELQQRLGELMDAREDHVRYYALCGKDRAEIIIDGTGIVSTDPAYRIL